MACEMDLLFCQLFSGRTEPLSPHSFLHGMWCSSETIAGYEQQDAHEFFIALLAAIRASLRTVPAALPTPRDAALHNGTRRHVLDVAGCLYGARSFLAVIDATPIILH